MKELINEIVDIPDYALSYLINADSSGMEESDIINTDNFMQKYYALANKYNANVIISPVDCDDGSFCSFPAFGLASNCFECHIIILVDNNTKI